jgi:membrane protease YdiL (CAAX protease family)
VATLLAVRFLHARPMKTLITAETRIRWGRMFVGAVLWFVIASLISLIEALLYPGRYVFSFQPLTLLIFTLFALILIPIQTSSEELFFRGYLLQWMGLRLKNIWVLSFLNGILFFLPHAVNPEMAVDAVLVGLGYFVVGFFYAFITLKDNGMELALGMHAANNLFATVVANYAITALPSPSLFTIQVLDPVYGLIAVVGGSIVFYVVYITLLVPKAQHAYSKEDQREPQ